MERWKQLERNKAEGVTAMDGQRPLTKAEHDAFCQLMNSENQRLSDEDKRQNRRIDELEQTVHQIGALTTSVEKLAVSMESMVKEQEQQGRRLAVLEGRDGEMWRRVAGHVITAVAGIVAGFVFSQIGM